MTTQKFLEFFPKHIIVTPTEHPKSDNWNRLSRNVPDKQELGVAVYFTPNGFHNSRPRGEDNVTQFNSIYIDLDCPKIDDKNQSPEIIEEYIQKKTSDIFTTIEPSFIVRTKNGAHFHFLLEEPVEVTDETKQNYIHVMDSMVEHFDADDGAKGINRVLRVPGYKHFKDINDPFDVHISYEAPDTRYTLEGIAEAIGIEYPAPVKAEKVTTTQVNTLEDSVLLDKMFSCKNGDKNKAAWEGDSSHWNDDLSSTDMALVSALAFWTGNDTDRMERLWLQSPLGQREKTQERADYRQRTLENAQSAEVYTPTPTVEETKPEFDWESLLYKKNKDGDKVYLNVLENIIQIVRYYNISKYDAFKNRYFIKVGNKWEYRTDEHDLAIYSRLANEFSFLANASPTNVRLAINKVSKENEYDSATEYCESLSWDGEARIDHWLHKVFGVEDDKYHRDIGSSWMKGMVSRMIWPGCKFDHALIIKGGQGIGKSSAFLELCSGFSDGINSTEFTDCKDKQLQEEIQGKIIAEFSEGAVFRKSDQETVKSIITRQNDRYRVPFETHARDFPRRCVFAVTTNTDGLLKDDTGNRRWWPVDCGDFQHLPSKERPRADIGWLKANKEQMFAEAYYRLTELDETQPVVDQDELERRQTPFEDERDDADLYTQAYLSLDEKTMQEGVTVRMIYNLAFPPATSDYGSTVREQHISKSTQMAVTSVLKNHKGLNLQKDRRIDTTYWIPRDPFQNFTVAVSKHEQPLSKEQMAKMQTTIKEDNDW